MACRYRPKTKEMIRIDQSMISRPGTENILNVLFNIWIFLLPAGREVSNVEMSKNHSLLMPVNRGQDDSKPKSQRLSRSLLPFLIYLRNVDSSIMTD